MAPSRVLGPAGPGWKLLSFLALGAGGREHSLQPQAFCLPAVAQSAKEEPGPGRRKTHKREAEAGSREGELEDAEPELGKPCLWELRGHRRAAEPWTRPLLTLGPQARGTDMQSYMARE